MAQQGERAGRFKGENRSECGMHHAHTSESSEGLNKRAERIRAGYVWEQVSLFSSFPLLLLPSLSLSPPPHYALGKPY